MRKLLILVLVISGLWAGYWFAGSSFIRQGAEQWFAGVAAQGLVAETTGLSIQGFPNRFDLTVQGVQLADPASGLGWAAPFVQVFAMTWKPWHIIAALPPEQVVTLPDQTLTLASTGLMASLRAKPAVDLPLAETRLATTSLTVTSDLGWTFGLGPATIALRALPDLGPSTYALGLDAGELAPDPGFITTLRAVTIPDLPPSDLPDRITSLSGQILLTLSAPLDRHLGTRQPYLTRVEVTDLGMTWGALGLSANGLITPDTKGYAAGKITVTITNWNRLPALLIAVNTITPELAPTLANALRALAAQSPDPNSLSLPLTLSDGRMSFGFLPLGPAPLMVPPSG